MSPSSDTITKELPGSRRPRSWGKKASQAKQSEIGPSRKDFARARNSKWLPPCAVTPEQSALNSLKAACNNDDIEVPEYEDYISKKPLLVVEVNDFEIYRCPSSGPQERRCEFLSLDHVPKPTDFYFDGFVCVANVKRYVEKIHFTDIQIEGFGDEESPRITTWIQSKMAKGNKDYDIWYKLNRPAVNYKRFHDPFLWVAQLAKHVIDYMDEQSADSVGLEAFRTHFHEWLTRRFPRNSDFQRWHAESGHTVNFRVTVNAHIDFISRHIPGSDHVRSQPLWAECMVNGNTCIKKQPQVVKHTLATTNVFECFKDMYFGECLKELDLAPQTKAEQEDRKRKLGFPEVSSKSISSVASRVSYRPCKPSEVEVGDTIVLNPDAVTMEKWKDLSPQWLAYVQGVNRLQDGTQELSCLWIYRPGETNMFDAKYPIGNELFLSDVCNCGEEFLSTDVIGKFKVDWSPTVAVDSTEAYFIRQTYVRNDSAFITFRPEHKTCHCKRDTAVRYRRGDTIYRMKSFQGKISLDPVIVQGVDLTAQVVTVRKLHRLKRDCRELAATMNRINIAPNELVLTDKTEKVPMSEIQHGHKCSIRFVRKDEILHDKVPFPYCRGGAGDFWFVSMYLKTSKRIKQLSFLSEVPDCLLEYQKMDLAGPKLRGLSIFSGGGSLDRGLEEGGAVEVHTAVDISGEAIHTQRANAKHPLDKKLYYGSVDDYLKASGSGKQSRLIVRIGDVDIIFAGSPCPGYSSLQQDKDSDKSKKNASYITSFCSYVDLYRPQYGILENVVTIGDNQKGAKGQNVLAQLVACLLSLGYQVNQFIMDAWNYGSAQQRSRAIITIAAPGLAPIIQPWHTHRTEDDPKKISLGPLPTGGRYGEREAYPTPFGQISAANITADLPKIVDCVQSCIPFPDHRLTRLSTWKERARFACIPAGQGYQEAYDAGLIPPELETNKMEIGKAYRRIKETGLIPTITTTVNTSDARNGASGHWIEDRPIGMLEARRAQGYPDDEPVIGSLTQQIRIVGNGVDRWVSFALGLALRRAVDSNSTSGEIPTKSSPQAKDTTEVSRKQEKDSRNDSNNTVIHPRVPRPKPKPKPERVAAGSKRRWREDESETSDSMESSYSETPTSKKQKTSNILLTQPNVNSSMSSSHSQSDLRTNVKSILTTRQTRRTHHLER